MDNVREIIKKININAEFRFNEPMWKHTSFQIGGPAEIFCIPRNRNDLLQILHMSKELSLPVFPLGEGANILVSDKGIRGIVLDMSLLNSIGFEDTLLKAGAGLAISTAAALSAFRGLSGIDNFYSMPGSVGGAIWMNARCYDVSVSDSLEYVDVITLEPSEMDLLPRRVYPAKNEFAYKRSPFQSFGCLIIEGGFRLTREPAAIITERIRGYRYDRESKGHFSAPCAGSVFKNNRDFGAPTGKILDDLGFRGFVLGRAKVSDLHANIIVNTGSASAREILSLIEFIEEKVAQELGYKLEREILMVGEW
ncbi:MAG: UDP-N-acetylmuramate dehydrogenase [Spirochaetota bacterium]